MTMKKFAILIATCAATLSAMAGLVLDVGKWRVAFSERDATLHLENAALKLLVEGGLSFESEGLPWRIVEARDGAAVETKMRDDGLLAVTVSAPASQDVKAVLRF